MKLLTLNTHSLVEDNYEDKLNQFVSAIEIEKPDVIALQEVNQRLASPEAEDPLLYYPCGYNDVIREDNHIFNAVRRLCERGIDYYWMWVPIKKGYDVFDEGIGIMSLSPIVEAVSFTVSKTDDYSNWKRRKLIGVRVENDPTQWFFSAHFGWWDDPDEPFQSQWTKACEYLETLDNAWVLGDFNSPAQVRGGGYDMVLESMWQDSYANAENRDKGTTVKGIIDGWLKYPDDDFGMRIDYIFSRKKHRILSSEVVFNGVKYPVVSDHYGITVEYERNKK